MVYFLQWADGYRMTMSPKELRPLVPEPRVWWDILRLIAGGDPVAATLTNLSGQLQHVTIHRQSEDG